MTDKFSNNLKEENFPLTDAKRFDSLNEFKLLEEFPETKPLMIVDFEGKIIYANHSFEKTFSLKEGGNFSDLESEPNLLYLIEGLSKSRYSSFHFELFLPYIKPPASTIYFVEIERIFISSTEYYVLILTSLEERNKIENRINNLHNALEYGNVPVIITDAAGKINYSTKSFEEILNISIEHLFHKPIIEVLSGFLDTNEISDLKNKIEKPEKCIKIISDLNEDGNLWFMELIFTPVYKSEEGTYLPDGKAGSFIITANDITNYVLKNRIAKRSEERQKSIINNISDLLLIIRNERGELIFENANDNFYDIFSLNRSDAEGKKYEEVLEHEFYQVLMKNIEILVESNLAVKEFKYRHAGNMKEYIGSITYTDDHYEDQRIFIISLKDITEQLITEERLRKAYERETHISKLKSSFLANMSHEIRTPLNAIVGYSELIEDDVKSGNNESALELFNYLKDGYNRLINLVDNILEVTLIQSGETDLEFAETNVNNAIKSVYQKMINFAVDKGITLSVVLAEEKSIRVDNTKLNKIMIALVDNAIKYNESNGSVLIQSKYDQYNVRIIISDTGKGIKEEELSRMFEPFAQEDEGHRREYEGAGLGLTIAYNLTKLMGGTFNVESVKNKGTIITLSFPIV